MTREQQEETARKLRAIIAATAYELRRVAARSYYEAEHACIGISADLLYIFDALERESVIFWQATVETRSILGHRVVPINEPGESLYIMTPVPVAEWAEIADDTDADQIRPAPEEGGNSDEP